MTKSVKERWEVIASRQKLPVNDPTVLLIADKLEKQGKAFCELAECVRELQAVIPIFEELHNPRVPLVEGSDRAALAQVVNENLIYLLFCLEDADETTRYNLDHAEWIGFYHFMATGSAARPSAAS